MKICPYCAYENREGIFFCEECGQPLISIGTQQLITAHLDPSQQTEEQRRTSWGTAHFDGKAAVILRFKDSSETMTLPTQAEVMLGRRDTQTSIIPDLDLTPFGASECGVSRRHAVICRGEDTLTLIDLASTNGTHLNGQQLIPHQPRVLHDGDEVRLGRLVFHLYFK